MKPYLMPPELAQSPSSILVTGSSLKPQIFIMVTVSFVQRGSQPALFSITHTHVHVHTHTRTLYRVVDNEDEFEEEEEENNKVRSPPRFNQHADDQFNKFEQEQMEMEEEEQEQNEVHIIYSCSREGASLTMTPLDQIKMP